MSQFFAQNVISEPSDDNSALPQLMPWRWFGARAVAMLTLTYDNFTAVGDNELMTSLIKEK